MPTHVLPAGPELELTKASEGDVSPGLSPDLKGLTASGSPANLLDDRDQLRHFHGLHCPANSQMLPRPEGPCWPAAEPRLNSLTHRIMSWINGCCPKPFSFEVVCYTAIANWLTGYCHNICRWENLGSISPGSQRILFLTMSLCQREMLSCDGHLGFPRPQQGPS